MSRGLLLVAMIPKPILWVLVFVGIIYLIALWPRQDCIKCGKNCAGRIAGGTVDDPICIQCVREGAK